MTTHPPLLFFCPLFTINPWLSNFFFNFPKKACRPPLSKPLFFLLASEVSTQLFPSPPSFLVPNLVGVFLPLPSHPPPPPPKQPSFFSCPTNVQVLSPRLARQCENFIRLIHSFLLLIQAFLASPVRGFLIFRGMKCTPFCRGVFLLLYRAFPSWRYAVLSSPNVC